MPKQDIVSAAIASIQSGQNQVLTDAIGAAVDQAALEQKSSDGTLSQSDVDAAVKAATDPLNQQIADLTAKDAADVQALSDAQAKAASDLSAIQAQLDSMTAKDAAAEALVSGLQGSISALQGSLDAIKAAVAVIVAPPSA